MNPLSPPSLPFFSSLPSPFFLVFLALVPAERPRLLLALLLPRVERDLDLELDLALMPRLRDAVRLVAVLRRRPCVWWLVTVLDLDLDLDLTLMPRLRDVVRLVAVLR